METPKKMSLMQLTVLVAVNMMGLRDHHAADEHGPGRRHIAAVLGRHRGGLDGDRVRFAQCGLFNSRPGGMSAYAEDAYGKPGNSWCSCSTSSRSPSATSPSRSPPSAISPTFMPGMSATPIATCISVIGLLWLTTVCNFGGPSVTGKIGSVTVWGVIIPVAGLSVIGWFWFKSEVFARHGTRKA